MASIKSLGLSSPSALQYAITEGILPSDPSPKTYRWQKGSHGPAFAAEAGEELLLTGKCVIWSRGATVRRCFRFDVENEDVQHACFARFPKATDHRQGTQSSAAAIERARPNDGTVPQLKIKKRTTLQEDPWTAAQTAPTDHEGQSNAKDKRVKDKGSTEAWAAGQALDRALVVVLKSQAHIFFHTGARHVIHLPFEVDSVFALPCGIVLQRYYHALHSEPVSSPPMPSAPANSFAFNPSRSLITSFSSQSQSEQSDDDPASTANLGLSLSSLFPITKPKKSSEQGPAHIFIRDPMLEPGFLYEAQLADRKAYRKGNGRRWSRLSPREELLYMSPQNEVNRIALDGSVFHEPLIAITLNRDNGQYTLWDVNESLTRGLLNAHQRRSRLGTTSVRRKSSRLPASGADTPGGRGASGLRENLNLVQEEDRHVRGRSVDVEEPDMAVQLDPAFQNPRAPAKSSRRISSLLARSDLSFNRDPPRFPDSAANTAPKRGLSFGGRTSLDSVHELQTHRRYTRGLTPDLISSGMSGVNIDGISNDPNSDDEENEAQYPFDKDALFEPQPRLTLRKIHNFSVIESFSALSDAASLRPPHLRIFTIRPPAIDSGQSAEFALCILNRKTSQLFVLYVIARGSTEARESWRRDRLSLHVNDVHKLGGVIDACKVEDATGRSRILVITQSASKPFELTLQSPWSTQLTVRLPERLRVTNSNFVDAGAALGRMREGGLNRVLSHKVDVLHGLEYGVYPSYFDGQDLSGTWHSFQLQISPISPFVSKCLTACEQVAPRSATEREPLLRAWWDVMVWLRSRSEDPLTDEWTGFVLVIFSLYIPLLSKKHKPRAPTRRRKGGLLRSSSGANVDQEAFEQMMAIENVSGAAPLTWLQETSWQWTVESDSSEQPTSNTKRSFGGPKEFQNPMRRKIAFLSDCLALALNFLKSDAGVAATGDQGYFPTARSMSAEVRMSTLPRVLIALHLVCEDQKLDSFAGQHVHALNPLLAQLARWLRWDDWLKESSSSYVFSNADMDRWTLDENEVQGLEEFYRERDPPTIMAYISAFYQGAVKKPFPALPLASRPATIGPDSSAITLALTPRTRFLFEVLKMKDLSALDYVRSLESMEYSTCMAASLPESVTALFRSKIAACQAKPASSLPLNILEMIGRDDIAMLSEGMHIKKIQWKLSEAPSHNASHDFHTISTSVLDVEPSTAFDGSSEHDRNAVTRLIFQDDQRFFEAVKILHPLKPATARCVQYDGWSEADLLEAQQELVKIVAIRTLSVSPGRGMLYYCARMPLLTEKFPIHGFSLSCVMKPSNTTVTADRTTYTEEKVSWAFFHAGVEAGLTISKAARGIDTSWITFNKPSELNNRHAGFLLALGLNGHLKSIAKWVTFKYLTPKHTMTAVGLLLGLAASYIGTMDPLITRLISVHVMRMLPQGAAELNVSSPVQTAGLMAIGLMYCGTQHRRMSEVMMSEMENMEHDDSINPAENLRDEGYRLAAGLALGHINLGQGNNLKGLHDMQIIERLLALAVATKKVQLVHMLDKATAAATIAIALIFMKTGDQALARKIDVPDTVHQFDYVRPDIFLLRTVARHLIMWHEITPTFAWISEQLPPLYRDRSELSNTHVLESEDLPLYNIIAGVCWSIGLRFAGSAREDVRNLLGHYLDQFMRICNLPAVHYDSRLTRITARNCQDTVALAAASVMAGTGDVWLFRRLRALHGRTDPDVPFGSHLAAHMAIGALFLAGGTHTFATHDRAVASLLAAFYPLWPTAVLDNKCHLQAFRHLWALAAEPRCLVVRTADAHQPITLPVTITLRTGESMHSIAPCLLPELGCVASVGSRDPTVWPIVLDLAHNPLHRVAFSQHQSLFVHYRGASDECADDNVVAGCGAFTTTMRALQERRKRSPFQWVLNLPALKDLDRTARSCLLPLEPSSSSSTSGAEASLSAELAGALAVKPTPVDDRLALELECTTSGQAERLWNLKALFAWSDSVEDNAEARWLGKEVVEGLRAKVTLRGQEAVESSQSLVGAI